MSDCSLTSSTPIVSAHHLHGSFPLLPTSTVPFHSLGLYIPCLPYCHGSSLNLPWVLPILRTHSKRKESFVLLKLSIFIKKVFRVELLGILPVLGAVESIIQVSQQPRACESDSSICRSRSPSPRMYCVWASGECSIGVE